MIDPIIKETDFALYRGNCIDVLPQLVENSVDCIVTSPPYYGLRDYGTGKWVGGREGCTHEEARKKTRYDYTLASSPIQNASRSGTDARPALFREVCPECGARRVDDQIGLEATVEEYVQSLVDVFSASAHALCDHGTLWVNLGDSYGPKGLYGAPWRFALKMQEAGWCLRRDVIWSKDNPMTESTKNRPTTEHEYLFMFTRINTGYYYDYFAVLENAKDGTKKLLRSVWEIPTATYSGQHFAVFPREIVRRCIEASCPRSVCTACGKPITRIVEGSTINRSELPPTHPEYRPRRYDDGKAGDPQGPGPGQRYSAVRHIGWEFCDCSPNARRPGVVLDPFLGSGTTAKVARDLSRNSIGIELKAEHCDQIQDMTAQLSLLNLEVA